MQAIQVARPFVDSGREPLILCPPPSLLLPSRGKRVQASQASLRWGAGPDGDGVQGTPGPGSRLTERRAQSGSAKEGRGGGGGASRPMCASVLAREEEGGVFWREEE